VAPNFLDHLFLNSATAVPDSLAEALHVETRVDGLHVEELTQMLVGPQASGLAGRLNPDTVNLIAKSDPLQAYLVLERYASLFPTEVSWLKDNIRRIESPESPVVERENDSSPTSP
jgi:hypothetical protein